MLAGGVTAVVEVPQLGALVARVPLPERVAQADDPLLGPRLVLVTAASPEDGVEPVGPDRVQQGVVCRVLRVPSARSRSSPRSMYSCTEPTTSRRPSRSTVRSRNSRTSGKLWPVSTWTTGKGILPGQKAFAARWSITTESLPPEKSMAGRSNSATTSRMMWIASASRASWTSGPAGLTVPGSGAWVRVIVSPWSVSGAALRRGCRTRSSRSRPSARLGVLPGGDGAGAGTAADRRVAVLQEQVHGHVVVRGVADQVVEAPRGDGVDLDHAVGLVPAHQRGVRARRRLVPADAGEPQVVSGQRPVEGSTLRIAQHSPGHGRTGPCRGARPARPRSAPGARPPR